MFDVLGQINWLAVLVAAVATIAFAAVYFTRVIAGPYLVALGRQGLPAPGSSPVRDLGPIVCLLLTTIASAVLIEALDVTEIGDAVVFGLVVGIGYLTAMAFQIALNPNIPRPIRYGLLNAPFFVLSSVVASVLLVVLR